MQGAWCLYNALGNHDYIRGLLRARLFTQLHVRAAAMHLCRGLDCTLGAFVVEHSKHHAVPVYRNPDYHAHIQVAQTCPRTPLAREEAREKARHGWRKQIVGVYTLQPRFDS